MIEKMKQLWKDEEGATAVEYGVMVAAIIGVIIAVVISIGINLEEAFTAVDEAVATVPGTTGGAGATR